jgi:hypothetical protein
MHAKADKGEIDKKVVEEFDEATKKQKGGFKALPDKKKSEKKKSEKKSALSKCASVMKLLNTEMEKQSRQKAVANLVRLVKNTRRA